VSNNIITGLPNELWTLSSLILLDLSGNNLSTLSEDICNIYPDPLATLDVGTNCILENTPSCMSGYDWSSQNIENCGE